MFPPLRRNTPLSIPVERKARWTAEDSCGAARIAHDGRSLFRGLPQPFVATRYHSLVVAREGLPDCLEVSAETSEGTVMGLRHRELPVEGVQFHPESILTVVGKALLGNFLDA